MTLPECSSSTSMMISSIGSSRLPVVFIPAEDHFRARYAEFESLAAHRLDQDGKLQFTAAGDDIGVGIRYAASMRNATLPSASRKQSFADDPALDLVAFGAGERRIVDQKGHR